MPLRPLSRSGVLEAAAILILASAIGTIAFSPMIGGLLNNLQPQQKLFGILILLPLTWAALRGNRRNAATAALIFCGTAIWGVSASNGAFSQTNLNDPLLLLALSIGAPLSALALSAAIARHRDAEANLALERDQLGRQVAQTSLALESSRRLFQILMDGITDYAIFVLDTSGRVASWNDAAKQIVGYTAQEIVGQHFGIFYRPDERRTGEPSRALEIALQQGKHEVEGWRIKKNGTLLFVTGSITSIRDKSGNLVGFANILRDATERRDAQEKLVEAREQLVTAQKNGGDRQADRRYRARFQQPADDHRRECPDLQAPA
jgi:PAS domain S-box-containing protein